jgi:hypothetical protein
MIRAKEKGGKYERKWKMRGRIKGCRPEIKAK